MIEIGLRLLYMWHNMASVLAQHFFIFLDEKVYSWVYFIFASCEELFTIGILFDQLKGIVSL